MEPTLKIATPENVSFGYEIAGIGSRFLAALVDSLIIVLLQVLGFFVSILLLNVTGLSNAPDASAWGIALIGLISFALLWGYYIFFEMIWNGQSPGKRLGGLRVVRTDGTPITLAESIVRNLVRLIDFLPTFYGVGVVTMFIQSQSRRLGDLAAGTLVVRENGEQVSLEDLGRQAYGGGLQTLIEEPVVQGIGRLPVELLREEDIQLIEEFQIRHSTFENADPLARHILATLAVRMGLPADSLSNRAQPVRLLRMIATARRAPAQAEPKPAAPAEPTPPDEQSSQ